MSGSASDRALSLETTPIMALPVGLCNAEHAERLLADEPIASDASRSLVTHQPLGPLLAVMPWKIPIMATSMPE